MKSGVNSESGIVCGSLQDSSIPHTTVLLQVVTECTNPVEIGCVALVLLLDESQCQGHIPVGLGCQFLDERDNLCTPTSLSLEAALISPPLCTPPLCELSGGKMSPQALGMLCPQFCDRMDWLISVVRQPITVSSLPLMGIKA